MGRLIPAEGWGELIDPYVLSRENAQLVARVQELEAELVEHVKIPIKVANQIKIDGIEDLREYFGLSNGGTYTDADLDEFIGVLESKDE